MHYQATRKFTFKLEYSKPIDLNHLDSWLVDVLKVEIPDDRLNSPIESLITKKLCFISYLFQTILLPCFDYGKILNIKQERKNVLKWSAEVELVNIDNIPDITYQLVIKFAFKAINWMMENQKNTRSIEFLYQSIQKDIINKLKGISGSGKSTIPILKSAYYNQINFFHLGGGTYQLGCGSKSRLINRSTSDLDSNIGAKMSTNKMMTSNLIRMSGLPAPTNALSDNINSAIALAKKIRWPIVVKPLDADRGEGVSVGIVDNNQLKIAFEKAKRFSKSKKVIIESEVKGVAHRIFIINNKLLYAVKRLPISIEGDGKKRYRS